MGIEGGLGVGEASQEFSPIPQFKSINSLVLTFLHSPTLIITSWQIDGGQWKQWPTLFFWAPKSLQMVTEAMKLTDAYFLEGKL